jgi:citrate lyase subunit beta/citryl-CoA lyase
MAEQSTIRPRRSVLYVPAANPRALEKARGLGCDALIVDLEDSVAPEAKLAARQAASAAVQAGFGGRETVVRCNGLDTTWGAEDLAAIAAAGPDAVLAPKIRSAADIEAYDAALAKAPRGTRLWAMVETAEGVLNLAAIAAMARTTRLQALVFGPSDLAAELRLKPELAPMALQPVRVQIVLAARAHGLIALGGVFLGLQDSAGLEADCRAEAGLGFDGKTLVHPSQIAPANLVFSPSPEEVAWARKVVDAFAAPEAAGKGVLSLEGRMIEHLHLRDAERVLRLAAG